jgi:hypothetical protein
MKSLETAAALLAAVAFSGCSGVVSRVHQGQVGETIDQRPESRGYFEAIGIGASDPALPTVTQRKALARDAAIVKAQYELLSLIKGVALEGGVSVSQAMEKDSLLAAKVNALLRGAEVRKTEFTTDNGCVVTMRLPKSRLDGEFGGRF